MTIIKLILFIVITVFAVLTSTWQMTGQLMHWETPNWVNLGSFLVTLFGCTYLIYLIVKDLIK